MEQIHFWIVKRGKIKVAIEGSEILLEIDTEQSDSCLMTPQDAQEIAGILTMYAHEIWRKTEKVEHKCTVEVLSESFYRWQLTAGEITIGRERDSIDIALGFTGAQKCILTMAQAVEIVQILEHLLKNSN